MSWDVAVLSSKIASTRLHRILHCCKYRKSETSFDAKCHPNQFTTQTAKEPHLSYFGILLFLLEAPQNIRLKTHDWLSSHNLSQYQFVFWVPAKNVQVLRHPSCWPAVAGKSWSDPWWKGDETSQVEIQGSKRYMKSWCKLYLQRIAMMFCSLFD